MHETDALDEHAAPSGGRPSALRADLALWVGAFVVGMAILGFQRVAVWIAHRPSDELGGSVGDQAVP